MSGKQQNACIPSGVTTPRRAGVKPLESYKMNSRNVAFYSDGVKLAGRVLLPDSYLPGERRPAVLICHGRFAIKEWVPSRWTPYFLAAGYVCMVFDYRNLSLIHI